MVKSMGSKMEANPLSWMFVFRRAQTKKHFCWRCFHLGGGVSFEGDTNTINVGSSNKTFGRPKSTFLATFPHELQIGSWRQVHARFTKGNAECRLSVGPRLALNLRRGTVDRALSLPILERARCFEGVERAKAGQRSCAWGSKFLIW